MAQDISEINYEQNNDAQSIRDRLERFLQSQGGEHRVIVFRSSGDNLRAILVSDHFKGMGASSRQREVWDYLEQHDGSFLKRLFGIHPYSWAEYQEEFVEQT